VSKRIDRMGDRTARTQAAYDLSIFPAINMMRAIDGTLAKAGIDDVEGPYNPKIHRSDDGRRYYLRGVERVYLSGKGRVSE
jgi:hypothetical protein